MFKWRSHAVVLRGVSMCDDESGVVCVRDERIQLWRGVMSCMLW